jgi:hypothetical protein
MHISSKFHILSMFSYFAALIEFLIPRINMYISSMFHISSMFSYFNAIISFFVPFNVLSHIRAEGVQTIAHCNTDCNVDCNTDCNVDSNTDCNTKHVYVYCHSFLGAEGARALNALTRVEACCSVLQRGATCCRAL